jgi:hypothetical protein
VPRSIRASCELRFEGVPFLVSPGQGLGQNESIDSWMSFELVLRRD